MIQGTPSENSESRKSLEICEIEGKVRTIFKEFLSILSKGNLDPEFKADQFHSNKLTEIYIK